MSRKPRPSSASHPPPGQVRSPRLSAAALTPASPWANGVRCAAWAAAILATAGVVCLQWVFKEHAGGLWRDEVNSVNLASMPSLADTWDNLQFDSFPIVWFLVLRAWGGLGLGSDGGLRFLGFLIGLISLGMLWFSARRLGARVPLLCLAVFAMNTETIRRGDSIRAYGLGTILLLLALALMWEMVQSPTPWRVAAAAAASVLSVQTLYYNSVLLLAIGAGAAVVAVRRRRWKRATLPIAIGLLAGASFLPYLPTIHRLGQWNIMAKDDLTLEKLWNGARDVLGVSGHFMVWVWLGLVLVALVAAGLSQVRRLLPELSDEQRDRALYGGTALLVGSAAYFVFLRTLSYGLNPWYFYAWMAFAAVLADALIGALAIRKIWGVLRIAAVVLIVATTFRPTWQAVHVRMTNLDLVASGLNQAVAEGDLVLVSPWMYGITFSRYYHGPAPWMTIPHIADHRTHRYELVRDKMKTPDAIRDIQAAMVRTLQSGHRVWVLDEVRLPPPGGYVFWYPTKGWMVADARRLPQGSLPPPIPQATDDPQTWRWPFLQAWCFQLGYIVQSHSAILAKFPIGQDDPASGRVPAVLRSAFPPSIFEGIHRFERAPVIVISGWRE